VWLAPLNPTSAHVLLLQLSYWLVGDMQCRGKPRCNCDSSSNSTHHMLHSPDAAFISKVKNVSTTCLTFLMRVVEHASS
jgi:hypothetical protein